MGNSMGRAPWRRSDTEATRGWTEGKPWEVAWGELGWEGAIPEGQTVGNSLGSSGGLWGMACGKERYTGMMTGWTEGKPWEIAWGELMVGRSDTEATRGWTEGKPWEIGWGDARWEGAIRE